MVYTFKQPGVYAYVNHNLIEAVMLGATAHVVVEGEWDDDLMVQVQTDAHLMPIENASVRWPEKLSPLLKLKYHNAIADAVAAGIEQYFFAK